MMNKPTKIKVIESPISERYSGGPIGTLYNNQIRLGGAWFDYDATDERWKIAMVDMNNDALAVLDAVEVPEPIEGDEHTNSFEGIIESFDGVMAEVSDLEDKRFKIECNRLLLL